MNTASRGSPLQERGFRATLVVELLHGGAAVHKLRPLEVVFDEVVIKLLLQFQCVCRVLRDLIVIPASRGL